jgi:uncharacterized Zn finger protein
LNEKIKIYCPFCSIFNQEVLIKDLMNGIGLSCDHCNQSVYIGETYSKIINGKIIDGLDLIQKNT